MSQDFLGDFPAADIGPSDDVFFVLPFTSFDPYAWPNTWPSGETLVDSSDLAAAAQTPNDFLAFPDLPTGFPADAAPCYPVPGALSAPSIDASHGSMRTASVQPQFPAIPVAHTPATVSPATIAPDRLFLDLANPGHTLSVPPQAIHASRQDTMLTSAAAPTFNTPTINAPPVVHTVPSQTATPPTTSGVRQPGGGGIGGSFWGANQTPAGQLEPIRNSEVQPIFRKRVTISMPAPMLSYFATCASRDQRACNELQLWVVMITR
ncbi:hypothetical protein AURDEDRAFT_121867 [Auricularia subglabra TFB-10046 SS5]|nr:hypothetical protein AURDEDRAFT_121867 [Auricularia subglabra TFB-10046 SS5]